jgi:hypothetical protein
MSTENHNVTAATKSLAFWFEFSERYVCPIPGKPELCCFGTGYNNWGVQTNQKYLGAMAILAASSEPARERALASLRFSLASHLVGESYCTDGTKWGHTWISGLGIERMMHGYEALSPWLEENDRAAFLRMLESEADWLLDGYERDSVKGVSAGLWARDHNHPESNIWNGAILARAAEMLPTHAHAAAWLEEAHRFLINGISVPADANDGTVIAGKPVRERYVGANFFPNYALDHHGYLNVGYMVICLSNIAMLHYSCRKRGLAAPESLYHHAHDLWLLVRRLIFGNGRLLRIGGDSRVRYCYCQDYLLPTLYLAAEYWRDPHARQLLGAALNLITTEQDYNGDGSYLSRRCVKLRETSEYYYTRLESDKAAVLSMLADWQAHFPLPEIAANEKCELSVDGGWSEPEHGAVFHRCPSRFASWSWRAASGRVQGLCLPPDDGHLAEWTNNCAGEITAQGSQGARETEVRQLAEFDGGFVTTGLIREGVDSYIPEGWKSDLAAVHHLAVAALPDGRTLARIELATAASPRVFPGGRDDFEETPTDHPKRIYLRRIRGVKYEIPSDLFNGFRRKYFSETGELSVLSEETGKTEIIPLSSHWVNVDDRLGFVGVYGAEGWSIYRQGARELGLNSIYADSLCYGCREGLWDVWSGETLLDNACLILSGATAEKTRQQAQTVRQIDMLGENISLCRGIELTDANGKACLFVANFGKSDREVVLCNHDGKTFRDLTGEKSVDSGKLFLPGGAAQVYIVE